MPLTSRTKSRIAAVETVGSSGAATSELKYRSNIAELQYPYLSRSWSDWDVVKFNELRKNKASLGGQISYKYINYIK